MKILFVNKFFFIKGGAETVFFQERDAMLQAGYQVVDFSMQHAENKPSPWKASSYITWIIIKATG